MYINLLYYIKGVEEYLENSSPVNNKTKLRSRLSYNDDEVDNESEPYTVLLVYNKESKS